MKFVALSGGIGSGKSTVRASLNALGAATIDVDAVSRELQLPGRPFFEQIVARWGPAVVGSDGQLNRAALSEIVFKDRAQLAELTAMAAPLNEAEIIRIASEHLDEPDGVVVVEAAMFQRPLYGMTALALVDVSSETAVERLVRSRGMAEAEARARIASQLPREERVKMADYIVDNDGTPSELEAQMQPLLDWIRTQPDAVPIPSQTAGEAASPA